MRDNLVMDSHWCDELKWTQAGILPAIAQDAQTGKVLMLAWMSPESLQATVKEGRAVYWSRSRNKLWRKGEESGNVQVVQDIRIDCDADTILLKVEQIGGIACHTGRHNCFFRQLNDGEWLITQPVLRSPEEMYGVPKSEN